MSYVADEHYAVYSETFPKARKEHQCEACDSAIQPGHKYARVFIAFDGKAESVIRCMRCQRIHEHLRDLGDGETWPEERLNCGQRYESEWGGEPPPEIAALAFALPGEVQCPPLPPT